jgi:uncharacterized protein (TIGR00288 family)
MPVRHTRQASPVRGPIAPVHRGPQAIAPTSSSTVPLHAPNAALLIDFDNVTMGIRSDLASELKNLLSSDIVKGKVSVQRAYADWRRYPQYIVPLSESSIDLIFAPAYGSSKKNATDIRLAIDALELVFTRPEIGTFILLSGDSDFSSLVIKLKEYGKYVIGVGIRESSSDLLVQNCDEYYSYNALAGLVNTRDEEIVKWDPWELTTEALQRMKRNGDVMRADRLKQVMQQIDSSFDEKNLGMSKFSRFILEAAQRGILSLHKMETGQYEVDLPKSAQPVEPIAVAPAISAPPQITTPAPAAVAALAEELNDEGSDDRRGRGKTRRGRGRGKEREERTAESLVTAPVSPTVSTPSAVNGVVDTIGASGIRLTRDEAFDLVRRAVESVATSDTPARASEVRRTARNLLGRDSESLSERNFTRILQDAHDADIIDLRRRGDDYEVSPAVVAAPIADQLSTAETTATPPSPTPSTPAVPRGMGPRGIPGRGLAVRGRKNAEVPSDLLLIGVVDYPSSTQDQTPVESVDQSTTRDAEESSASLESTRTSKSRSTSRGRKSATSKRSGTKSTTKERSAKSSTKSATKSPTTKRSGKRTTKR